MTETMPKPASNMKGGAGRFRGRHRHFAAVAIGLIAAAWVAGSAGLGAFAAGPEAPAERPADIATLRKSYRRPAALPAGAAAPAATVALGAKLFHSTELSANRGIACVSCHLPNAAYSDNLAKPIADNGRPMGRRSQTLYDMAWANIFLWDGRQDSLAGMVTGPISSPDIMGLPLDAMVERLSASPEFSTAFERVYPDKGPTAETVGDALAAYMRTLRSPVTRFDRWVGGNAKALSRAELNGFRLFNGKAKCAVCHSGWRLTDEGFRDIGLPDMNDPGRGRIKPDIESLAFAFKTPTLRGVAERAPYMHDGSLPTLEAVVEHYDRGGDPRPSLSPDIFPLNLTAQEKTDLVAFMRSLSPDPVTRSARSPNAAQKARAP